MSPRTGESAPFHFTTQWHLERPPAQVWDVFQDIARWPIWWPGVREVTVLSSGAEDARSDAAKTDAPREKSLGDDSATSGAANGEGTRAVLRVRRPVLPDLRVHLAVTRTDSPHRATVVVSGDLRGHGHWHAVDVVDQRSVDTERTTDAGPHAPTPRGCRVEFVWCVVTRSRLTMLLRGAAGWAHSRVMDVGEKGLREQLETAAT